MSTIYIIRKFFAETEREFEAGMVIEHNLDIRGEDDRHINKSRFYGIPVKRNNELKEGEIRWLK